jgi:hypothetical protein
VLDGDPVGRIGWALRTPWSQVLALRPLAGAEAARVKAYRRLVRERTLPPLLVWYVSGLGCYLLVDGHDRLAAAL